jgi:hypothetical protein
MSERRKSTRRPERRQASPPHPGWLNQSPPVTTRPDWRAAFPRRTGRPASAWLARQAGLLALPRGVDTPAAAERHRWACGLGVAPHDPGMPARNAAGLNALAYESQYAPQHDGGAA